MEEAGQALDIESFIPLMLQPDDETGMSRLKRVVLIGCVPADVLMSSEILTTVAAITTSSPRLCRTHASRATPTWIRVCSPDWSACKFLQLS